MEKPRRPAELVDPAARRYWDRHVSTLWEDGTLTTRDIDSFVVLCQVWGRLQALTAVDLTAPENFRAAVQHNNMLKQYQQYAARFGLIGPKGRTTKKQTITDMLNLKMGCTPEKGPG